MKSAQVLQIECWLYPGYGPETARMADIVEMLHDLVESSDPSEVHQLCNLDLYFVRKKLTKSCGLCLGSRVRGWTGERERQRKRTPSQ